MTPKQKHTLGFIKQFFLEHGFAPSYREIIQGTKNCSTSEVYRIVQSLVNDGVISMDPYRARSINILGYCEHCGRGGNAADTEGKQDTRQKTPHVGGKLRMFGNGDA